MPICYTKFKLGELCNPPIAESNIRKYENGNQNPKIETIERIAKTLQITSAELMGWVVNDYYVVDTGKDRFILYDYDIDTLYESTKASLPFLVNSMKDTKPEIEILNDNSFIVKNELPADKDNG